MAHLIDKDAVLAMVEERRQLIRPKNDSKVRVADVPTHIEQGWLNALTWVRDSINSLEVKEISLEKEIECSLPKPAWGWNEDYLGKSNPAYSMEQMKEFAKHFFELGLKVNQDVDLELIVSWFDHITQIADDRKTANGVVMVDWAALDEIKCLAKESSEFIKTHYKAQKVE